MGSPVPPLGRHRTALTVVPAHVVRAYVAPAMAVVEGLVVPPCPGHPGLGDPTHV